MFLFHPVYVNILCLQALKFKFFPAISCLKFLQVKQRHSEEDFWTLQDVKAHRSQHAVPAQSLPQNHKTCSKWKDTQPNWLHTHSTISHTANVQVEHQQKPNQNVLLWRTLEVITILLTLRLELRAQKSTTYLKQTNWKPGKSQKYWRKTLQQRGKYTVFNLLQDIETLTKKDGGGVHQNSIRTIRTRRKTNQCSHRSSLRPQKNPSKD